MTGFELSENYVEDLEALIRKTRAKLKKIPTTPLEDNQIRRSLT
jgi:predicted aminopeptidase